MAIHPTLNTIADEPVRSEAKEESSAAGSVYACPMTTRFWVGTALALPAFLLAMAHLIPAFGRQPWVTGSASRWMYRGWRSVVTRHQNMFTLIGIGVSAAFFLSATAMLAPGVPGLANIAPYAATSIAEAFMESDRGVLIVCDDLTHHARAYREISLLLRRPPGREACPGDIFYIHSRLLERATHLRQELSGGSLTALPIIETEAQDISAYIPTNPIFITDGQIYLSPSLFELGVLPAVDVGKSVSRVGGKAQRAAYRAVTGDLKPAYAQFEELETFSPFCARLDEAAQKTIEHGRRIRACLKQPEFDPVSVPEQIAVLPALTAKLFDRVPLDQMTDAEHALRKAAAAIPAENRQRLDTADKLSDETQPHSPAKHSQLSSLRPNRKYK